MRDWSTAIRQPVSHRVNRPWILPATSWNSRNFTKFFVFTMIILLATFLLLLFTVPSERSCPCIEAVGWTGAYNSLYPLTVPTSTSQGTVFRIAVITDLDQNSKSDTDKYTWFSYMRKGRLTMSRDQKHFGVEWDSATIKLKSTLSQGGRSMELSDLKIFDGHLLSVDDRTGVVYRLDHDQPVAWVVLPDGAGNETKGFKAEWLTVKGKELYVGGLGKEWTTTTGELQNYNPMWIKIVSPDGRVRHVDWQRAYTDLRAAVGIRYPGYMIHESAQWSDVHNSWFFLPRRASMEKYTEEADERRATNDLLIADEFFSHITTKKVGTLSLTRGYSAFQFIPGTKDRLIVALKSEEDKGVINSYMTIFDIDGTVLFDELQLEGNYKFEGIEFI